MWLRLCMIWRPACKLWSWASAQAADTTALDKAVTSGPLRYISFHVRQLSAWPVAGLDSELFRSFFWDAHEYATSLLTWAVFKIEVPYE